MTKEERREYYREYYKKHRQHILMGQSRRNNRYKSERQVHSHGYYRQSSILDAYERRKQQDTTTR